MVKKFESLEKKVKELAKIKETINDDTLLSDREKEIVKKLCDNEIENLFVLYRGV